VNDASQRKHRQSWLRAGSPGPLHLVRCNTDTRLVRLTFCRRFGPSPCPTHYGGRLATMPSADFCSNTLTVTRGRAARGGGRVRRRFQAFPPGPQSGSRDQRGPPIEQISPDRGMNFSHTTAAFTLPRDTGGLRHVVLTCPRARPSMRFLSVGSRVCARTSSRQRLAAMPLPSASSCHRRERQCRVSYRGLAPHQFMPMPGVHNALHRTASPLRGAAAAERDRWAA